MGKIYCPAGSEVPSKVKSGPHLGRRNSEGASLQMRALYGDGPPQSMAAPSGSGHTDAIGSLSREIKPIVRTSPASVTRRIDMAPRP